MPKPIRYTDPEKIANDIRKNIRTFTARFSEDVKNKLIENTQELWYDKYEPIYYRRMGTRGGVLGAIKRTSVFSEGKGNWNSIVYIDIDEIQMDVDTYTDKAGKQIPYGRHTDKHGMDDLREEVIGWMEETGISKHEEAAHMLETTSEWAEDQLSFASNIERYFDKTENGVIISLTKTRR